MTTSTHGKVGAYTNHQRGQEDGRETDARALLSCANRLRIAIEDGGKDMKAYGDAVRHNQKLWTMFQLALCEPDNALPPHLKQILLNLSRYIDRISFRAITGFMPQLLTEMIDINRRIATGLTKKPPTAAEGTMPQAPASAAEAVPIGLQTPVSIATSA